MRKNGFTMIEMLVVTVILGVIVLIAIPKFQGAKNKTYQTAATADLHQLQLLQESYFVDNLRYTTNLAELTDFVPSNNIGIEIRGSDMGWTARARHNRLPNRWCAVFVGNLKGNNGKGKGKGKGGQKAYKPAKEEGVIACKVK